MSQVKVTMRLCFLCYEDGINKKATHAYQTKTGDEYDICPKHKKLVDELELACWEINSIKVRGL